MAEITIKCVEGNPLAINVVMTAIEHSMLNGEMVTETVDFYPDTTKPVRAVLDCTTARRQYCPQTSVTDNVVYVSDNGSIAAGVYTLTITCTDTRGKKRRYKSDPCIEVYDATSAAEIAATFDSQTYELNGVFYTFAGGGGTVQSDWDETDPSAPSYIQNKPDLSEYATDEELQAVEESIPNVPAWALQPQKPAYTAGEVGAMPADTQFKTINNESILGNTDISIPADVYSKNESDSRYLKNADATSTYATKSYVSDALANVVYIGDDDEQATTADFDPQNDTVWNTPQVLGASQQAQARNNIGAQEQLVSGTNIKTINGESILGAGNISISGGSSGGGNVSSTTINTLVSISEADYEALATKDSSTLYIVTA